MSDTPTRKHDQELSRRIEELEKGQVRILGRMEALSAAQVERLDQRIEELERGQVRILGRMEALNSAQVERFDALEALLIDQLRAAGEARDDVRDCDTAQIKLAQRLEAQEGLLMDLGVGLRAALDRVSVRDLEQHDQLAALEGSISDQRHAVQRMAATFDNNAYSQRLEFQHRLANLMNSLVDQRQELASQLTAIEGGLSDLRVSRSHPGAAPPAGEPAETAGGNPAAGGGLERKLGIVIDCLLADHVAAAARQGLDAGDLEEGAYRELVQGLEELKLERLRSRHSGPDGADKDEGEA